MSIICFEGRSLVAENVTGASRYHLWLKHFDIVNVCYISKYTFVGPNGYKGECYRQQMDIQNGTTTLYLQRRVPVPGFAVLMADGFLI